MIAYIGLGANLGDARAQVEQALAQLDQLPGTTVLAASPLFRTAPIDSSGDDYINAVARLETSLDPIALLDALQDLEQQHGRERPYHNAPRTLDLDVLLYGAQTIDSERLTVPHPRMHERAFVLAPLLTLDPDLAIPGRGLVRELIGHVADQAIEPVA